MTASHLFAVNATVYSTKFPETKFAKHALKVKKANEAAIDAYNDKIDEINLELASTKDGNIVYDDINRGIYSMTRENKKSQIKRIKDLDKQEVFVTVKHIAEVDVPKNIDADFAEVFTPFCLAPFEEKEESESPAADSKTEVSADQPAPLAIVE